MRVGGAFREFIYPPPVLLVLLLVIPIVVVVEILHENPR